MAFAMNILEFASYTRWTSSKLIGGNKKCRTSLTGLPNLLSDFFRGKIRESGSSIGFFISVAHILAKKLRTQRGINISGLRASNNRFVILIGSICIKRLFLHLHVNLNLFFLQIRKRRGSTPFTFASIEVPRSPLRGGFRIRTASNHTNGSVRKIVLKGNISDSKSWLRTVGLRATSFVKQGMPVVSIINEIAKSGLDALSVISIIVKHNSWRRSDMGRRTSSKDCKEAE